ncbi:MAG: PIN domain-containing protein [Micropruina sp.]
MPPFQVFWTEDVLAEVIYHLRRKHPDWPGGRLSAIRDRIAEVFEVGRVADFPIDKNWAGVDQNDRHVHSAARACQADILLTADVGDFDHDAAPYSVYAPDDFFTLVDDSSPELLKEVAASEVRYWLARGREPHLPRSLRAAGCPVFAERVRCHLLALDHQSELFNAEDSPI